MTDIKDIEVFACLNDEQLKKISNLFEPKKFKAGTVVVQHSDLVDGLYLVVEGEFNVTIPDYEGVLAKLGPGSSFGEMTLFEDFALASASVSAASDENKVLFCARDDLLEELEVDHKLSAGLYKGSVIMMADRLRANNQKIKSEITASLQTASEVIDGLSPARKLEKARDQIDAAGQSIVSSITGVMKSLSDFKETGGPVSNDDIGSMLDTIQSIYYNEFQVFDKISQQLNLLEQHLENIRRILYQEGQINIKGDKEVLEEK